MYRLGIIKESLDDLQTLESLKPYLYSQREEYVKGDVCPCWHICDYRIEDNSIEEIADKLKDVVKETWYIHAFNDTFMLVILKGKFFVLPPERDKSWKEMIKYGVRKAKVKKSFLKNVPRHI